MDSDATSGVIQRLVDSVREAAGRTSRPQRLADRLARVFVPIVFIVATVVFLAHWKTTGLHGAFMSSMAVALIACPCALAIATPLAVWAALGNAAKHGVVFRSSDDLTTLSEIDHICIDKTGTVTTDQPRLANAWYDEGYEDRARQVANQLSAESLHPLSNELATRFLGHDAKRGMQIGPATSFSGQGVVAQITTAAVDGSKAQPIDAVLGSVAFCDERGLCFSETLQQATNLASARDQSVVCVGWGKRVRAVFAFDESLRPGAASFVQGLGQLGLRALLLTGDKADRASRVADELGLDASAQLLPGDKQQVITNLQSNGHKVAMLGDGLNDAPALGTADVGIALGCGSEVTRDAAGICLVPSELALLPWAVKLARVTKRTIHRNLIWAVTYNCVGIALAAAGKLNPIFAALAMVLSSGFVIAESLRLSALPGPLAVGVGHGQSPGDVEALSRPRDEFRPIGTATHG